MATTVGAVYLPSAPMTPPPESDHVTDLSVALVTVAVNVWVSPPSSVAVVGATATPTAGIVTVVETDFDGSTTEVAVTVALADVACEAGAVKRPLADMLPAPLTVQVTAVLTALPTVAVNCWLAPRMTVGVVGEIPMVTAGMLKEIDFVLLGSACDAARTVTVAGVVSVPGVL